MSAPCSSLRESSLGESGGDAGRGGRQALDVIPPVVDRDSELCNYGLTVTYLR